MSTDHDQRFKTLIQAFFPQFMALFFPRWAERLNAETVEWLTWATRSASRLGPRPTPRTDPVVEPCGDSRSESPTFSKTCRVDYMERFWELELVRFQYLYVGLPALEAVEYVQGDNCLGWALAALMRKPHERAAWVGGEGLRRIAEAPLTDQQRFLLAECMQGYLDLDEEQRREFENLVSGKPYEGLRAMNKTVYEQGMEKGMEKGLDQGQRRVLGELLQERFGPLPAAVQQRLAEWPAERLPTLVRAVVRAQSLKEMGLED
jgi:hypothetical protein